MHLSFLGDQPETRSHGDAAGQVRGPGSTTRWAGSNASSPARPGQDSRILRVASHPLSRTPALASVTLGPAPERGIRDG